MRKTGDFSENELKKFMERLNYFRSLGIENRYWGYFSIPFDGRPGYSFQNLYMKLLKVGKITSDFFEFKNSRIVKKHELPPISNETMRILINEAEERITKFCESNKTREYTVEIHGFDLSPLDEQYEEEYFENEKDLNKILDVDVEFPEENEYAFYDSQEGFEVRDISIYCEEIEQ